jgi:hypothetical protein
MKKSLTFLLGTLMVAGVLAGASTSTTTTKKGNTIQPIMHGAPGVPLCPSCTGGGNSGGNSGK